MTRFRLAIFSILPVFCALVNVSAQLAGQDPEALLAAQREAMRRLSFMDGVWRGPAWTILPSGEKHSITQTERIGPFLDGSVKVIEGRGYYASGYQVSHWKNLPTPIGIMNPTAPSGVAFSFTDADRRAMQALGYDVVITPEPSSVMLIGIGCTILSVLRRRRS